MTNERHFFPGSNSANGFYSLFKYILPVDRANRIFYIKGGPGTGKSYLMKKIADLFNSEDYTLEYFHCSSDNESLDALNIKDLNIALIDGTSPHMQDPLYSGALDEIIDFGVSLDKDKLHSHKDEIIKVNKDISSTFKRAFSYLNASKSIHDNWSYRNKEHVNNMALNALKLELKNMIFKNYTDYSKFVPFNRHLFSTAFTPNGVISYIDTLYSDCENIYILKGGPGTGKSEILTYIQTEALIRGMTIEILHHPLIPNKIEHLILPEINTAILTSNEINNKDFSGLQINTNDLLDNNIDFYRDSIKQDKENFHFMLNEALNILSSCKKLHDDLEEFYINNIDFNIVDDISNAVIQRILNYKNS
ncbi:PRK06851 family protein [Clostridium cochlearium]|uniref:PRK06851 family protein n=1 Tax=Clostridium cochlearium TaxID=1494 RepID=UPI00156ECDEB|nr:PRK06851 family protein [Clostridium cochlearium]MBV1816741.1 PRK06851 family protein [Bacteroidales bacterium MSK.15.36]NSJ90394.1 ATPase [Coprococcus sp. MSK.21.13]MBE6065176.1 ATPase [Clostridium cochlearium]MCG4570986.1 PRK06851 family protein [Clostridium cochlearium]MCG4579177.1 PRK06851 family protein [Clostridium cochlearium]